MNRLPSQTRRYWTTLSTFMLAAISLALLLTPLVVGSTKVSAQASLPGCWSSYESPLKGTYQELRGIAVLPTGEAWAVGYSVPNINEGGGRPLVLKFDGKEWKLSYSGDKGILESVAAISPDNVWAVGFTHTGTLGSYGVLILHWNGHDWRQVQPASGNLPGWLKSISAAAPDDIWAVGYGEISNPPGTGARSPLILHWNGHEWARFTALDLPAPTPAVTPTPSGPVMPAWSAVEELNSVVVVSRQEAWAVGYGTGDGFFPAVLRWDGTRWSMAQLPEVPGGGILNAVTVAGQNDVWAVGQKYEGNPSSVAWPLTMHWDGLQWRHVPSPAASTGSRFWNSLHGVAALSPDDVWAVGQHYVPRSQPSAMLMRWDGQEWILSSQLTDSYGVSLEAAAAGQGRLWVSGYFSGGGTRLLSYNTGPCAPTPTPTPIVPPNPPVPVPGNGTRLFPETGKTMTGIFLDYWNSHGGLPQQGYPISDVIGEVSDLNGRLYTMQYTERAIFEYHTENQSPYNVLLSHLGRFQLRNKYPTGTPKQTPNEQPGSILFKETGKRLGGAFLKYWQQNGGLMQQGYPITDEFTEVSELDRKPYIVQYFERAVFEYHPELKGTRYEVLLSQLGTYRWRDKYAQVPAPQHIAGNILRSVAANSRYIYYVREDRPTFSLYSFDLVERKEFLVSDDPGMKFPLAADDKKVVWGQRGVDSFDKSGIKGYDIATGQLFTVIELAELRISDSKMALVGDDLYYSGGVAGIGFGVIRRNLTTGREELIAQDGRDPVLSAGNLLWYKESCIPTGGNRPPCTFEAELYLRKHGEATDTLLSKEYGQYAFSTRGGYGLSGEYVIWASDVVGELTLYRMSTGQRKVLSEPYKRAQNPLIDSDRVIWLSEQGEGEYLLKTYNLSTGDVASIPNPEVNWINLKAIIGGTNLLYITYPAYSSEGELFLLNLGTSR